jgi:hypothetical protein
MKQLAALFTCGILAVAATCDAQVANIKVVTDASPDYSDMESMFHSITANWKTDAEKMWAVFYWNHIGRRLTAGMQRHGFEITDPIRQFNDYGYAHYQNTIGLQMSEWIYMGYPCRITGLSPEVWYDGRYHLYDNAHSMIYGLADDKTIAGSVDLAATMAGPETDGKPVRGYLGLYHALTATGPNSFAQGADRERLLAEMLPDYGPHKPHPALLQQRGHRYILDLRPGEIYTRYYARQDRNSAHAIILDNEHSEYRADPAAYVHNGLNAADVAADPEEIRPSYHLRGTGERTWSPVLDEAHLAGALYSMTNIKALSPGLEPAEAGKPAEAIFKVEGANVITSVKLRALASVAGPDDHIAISISTTQGATWKEVWKTSRPGENTADFQIVNEVNGVYDFLVRVTFSPAKNPADTQLKFIGFNTWTQINSKTQPQLNLGANTVYVGEGEQTASIVLDPELQKGGYKSNLVEEKNIRGVRHFGMYNVLVPQDPGAEAYLVFKVDAPTDITSLTWGGRFNDGSPKNHVELLHSFDGGKTWKQDASLTDPPHRQDVIHFARVDDVPAGTRSVLFKYLLATSGGEETGSGAGIMAVRMEVDHKLADPLTTPLEVTFHWRETKKNRTQVKRSHTQLIEKLPATYKIDVGGEDHAIVDSLSINLKGTRPDVAYGYSDGVDAGGEKWVGRWETVGRNLALGKPYTLSVESGDNWGAGDPDHKRLTDGFVGHSFAGGNAYSNGAIWGPEKRPEITVDLGSVEKCGAFRIHIVGFPWWDALKGEIRDRVEVLTSADGKEFTSAGVFNFKLFKKDIPLNYMIPDEGTLPGYNFALVPPAPVEARYIKYKLTPRRMLGVTEVQVLDSYTLTPFDLKIALPDPADNGKPPARADISPNARQWKTEALPDPAKEAITDTDDARTPDEIPAVRRRNARQGRRRQAPGTRPAAPNP